MSAEVVSFPGQVPQWSVADRLRRVRRDMDLGQEQFADLLGVGRKAYGQWEAGRNEPRNMGELSVRLEQITGVSRAWFLGWLDGGSAAPAGPRPTSPAGEGLDRRLQLVRPTGLEPAAFCSGGRRSIH